jgi:hypothetical protein
MKKANGSPSDATRFTVNHQPPIPIRRKSPYSQALAWQDSLNKFRESPDLKPVQCAILARAWRDVEAMKREIKMQPKPRPVDVTKAGGRRGIRLSDYEAGPLPSKPAAASSACCQQQAPAITPTLPLPPAKPAAVQASGS